VDIEVLEEHISGILRIDSAPKIEAIFYSENW
jgi:hypothetical protein